MLAYASSCTECQYALFCNTLQHTATHCNTLPHTATHYHTLHLRVHAGVPVTQMRSTHVWSCFVWLAEMHCMHKCVMYVVATISSLYTMGPLFKRDVNKYQ